MFPVSDQEQTRLQQENQNLKSAVEELSILNDFATAISSTQSLDHIIKVIIKKCVKHLNSEQGAVHLVDEKDIVNPLHTMIRIKDDVLKDPYRFNKQVSDYIFLNKKPLMINEFRTDEEFKLNDSVIIRIKSVLAVPMINKGKLTGIISLFNKKTDEGFTDNDKRLLSIIAAQSANVLENSRLLEEEKKLIRIQQELIAASEIQKNILPRRMPELEGYDIYAVNIPALEVGGDYYDFIKISETKIAVALGDVSGKGLPAAMLMANLQATLRGQLLFNESTNSCIMNANQLLYKSTDKRQFITLFFFILDTVSDTITYCNAGHNNPFLYQEGTEINLRKGGIVLGWRESYQYEEEEIPFCKGSVLVIYSDGVTEAMNKADEMYGEEKLFNLIRNNILLDSKTLADKILEDLREFAAGTPQNDDITLLIVKRFS